LLREKLGYRGIVITDAMVMGALDDFNQVDIRALESGVDIVLMPRNLRETHKTLVEKMTNDKKFEQEINDKVYRIVRMKLVQQWADQESY